MPKIALVTGSAGDLGRAASVALAGDGWTVLLTDHPTRTAPLEEARAACASAGVEPGVATFDVTDHDATRDAFRLLAARHGVPTAVFANAGVQGGFVPTHRYDVADLRHVLEVNVVGVFNVLRCASELMIEAALPGSIVTTASMAGVGGAPNMPAYSASKAAVIGLTKSAAKDLAPFTIRVNSISPAFIGPGAMWDNQVVQQAAAASQYYAHDPATVAEQMIAMIPLRRYGSPAEVADVVCYLVGERSSYLTGLNIEIAGGSV